MLTDLEIAHKSKILPITEIAGKLGLSEEDLELYGKYKAKLTYEAISRIRKQERGKLILVSAITPTPAGEGKTTTTIGLSQALNRIGKSSIAAIREPSLGPVFGIKGGAAGGGYSQVLPMEDINLHFTGDMHAVTSANNNLSALIDNYIYWGNPINLDPRTINWNRVQDVNDRMLRSMVVGLGGKKQGFPLEENFMITPASEIMAILCLSNDLEDLKNRIGNILIGFTYENKPVYVRDLGFEGAISALLKDALKPNLVQTTENTPAFVHGGPFANIAQGANSILATKMAMALSDYTVTEAGFGFDLGAEKFFDIVCRIGGFCTNAVVLVATVRALKLHGGASLKHLTEPDPRALDMGLENLGKHLENIRKFGMKSVVAINRFATDTDEELEMVRAYTESKGFAVSLVESHAKGGEGAVDLAEKVVDLIEHDRCTLNPLYPLDMDVEDKIYTIASEIYGAESVDFTAEAKQDLKQIKKLGLDKFPICMAKTQKSLSDNPLLLGRPKDFLVTVRKINISAGAGFLVPITGEVMLMPGLPKTPSAMDMDIDKDGNITNLF
jgi:formate--tetrahydrofolate ligase